MRTTSSVEAMNSSIHRSFPARTNIFKFSENLRLHESIKSSYMYQLSNGDVTNQRFLRRRKEDIERDLKITFFSTQLKNGTISVSEFLEAMSCKDVLPPVG